MNSGYIALSVVMILSASMLVYRWISMYKNDFVIIALTVVFVSSLTLFLLSIGFRLDRVGEELQSVKRTVIMNSDELKGSLESKLRSALRDFEKRIESIEKRLYR